MSSFIPPDADKNFRPQMSLGQTGLKHAAGYVFEEFLPRLQGINGVRLYREMADNSAIIGAALSVIELLVRQVDWRVEPADESPEAKEEAEFLESVLEDMSITFPDVVSETLSMLVYGWSYFETVYKLRKGATADPTTRSAFDDGKWGWRKIEIRAQDTLSRWVFDPDGGIRGMVQLDQYQGGGPVFIPIEKSLLFRTRISKGNPEGRSALRSGVLTWHQLKRIEEFEGIGVERDLGGMPVMEVPPELLVPNPSADQAQLKTELEQFITQVRMDQRYGGLVPSEVKSDGSPSQYKFKLLGGSGGRRIQTDPIVKRKESRLLMLFMSQFLMMGMDKVGSLSLSSNMTDLFSTAIGTYMDQIADVLNRFGVRRLQALNGKPQELDPVITHGDIEGPNLAELGQFLVSLATAGIDVTDPKIRRKLLEAGNLPTDVEDDAPREGNPEAADMQDLDATSPSQPDEEDPIDEDEDVTEQGV